MRLRGLWLGVLLAAGLVLVASQSFSQPTERYRGRSVQSVLDDLRAAGTPLAYSTNLVPDALKVTVEPVSREPLDLAREILAAHGLTLSQLSGSWLVVRAAAPVVPGAVEIAITAQSTGEPVTATVELDSTGDREPAVGGRAELRGVAPGEHVVTIRADGYVPERRKIEVAAGAVATVVVQLYDTVPRLEEIMVTASRYDVVDPVRSSASSFTRDEIETLSDLGDDAMRVAHRLPGIAASEFSARSHVRGGATDEMLVLLDGMELIEPYHLRDYQGVFSAIDQRIVSALKIYSGGFPASYGDALSGLTVIDPREPTRLAHEVGVSLLHTALLSSGTVGERATWLLSARRSNLADLLDNDVGEPAYHDVFGRVGVRLGMKHRLTVSSLAYDDDITLNPQQGEDDVEQAKTEVDAQQFWVALESDWTDALSSKTWLYSSHFDALRRETANDTELAGTVFDSRQQDGVGLKQEWRYEPSISQIWSFGFDAERFDGHLDYEADVVRRGLLAGLPPLPEARRDIEMRPTARKYGAYFSDRIGFSERVIAELGVRWDAQAYAPGRSDSQISPRSSLLVRLNSATDLRLSYGRFFQSEQIIDLPIEDGVAAFSAAQNASHAIIGIEHRFANDLAVRFEAFRKRTHDARVRFENVFDPLVLLPEWRPGRVRVAPERAESHGLEVFVSGGSRMPWWLGYSVSRAEDVIVRRSVPRSWDQRYALDAGVTRDVKRWSVGATASLHSGWPTTAMELVTTSGQPTAVLLPRNAERLRSLRRIDVRASRTLDVAAGDLQLFVEITNLTGRNNPCCVRYEEVMGAGGVPALSRTERFGLPLTGNLGFLWEF